LSEEHQHGTRRWWKDTPTLWQSGAASEVLPFALDLRAGALGDAQNTALAALEKTCGENRD
jgi:hypothetical protein